jgi:hypothetical protein
MRPSHGWVTAISAEQNPAEYYVNTAGLLAVRNEIGYGPLLKLIERLVPEPSDRSKLLWRTPNRQFGLADP